MATIRIEVGETRCGSDWYVDLVIGGVKFRSLCTLRGLALKLAERTARAMGVPWVEAA